MQIDDVDKAILDCLIEDAKISHQQIGEKVNSSQASVWRRIKALEAAGIIEGYTVRVSDEKMGFELTAFALVNLNRHSKDNVGKFETVIKQSKAVLECHSITGQADYLLKIHARNIRDYELFLNAELFSAPGVEHVHTSISLRQVKR
ncbi:AsnC family transcriptional regulator [Kordiimonas sediminis]|uniref:AsnC family transcriptional regulator n=1 Tax=Kordiimonas sediminis TaxID=1735581 RepID=A0A919AJ90_9PROT|nr:Lrp/AsnC family transcriptional regulator [Kordiimonas sediminis]GHF10829.1 AsnC family transcriptional regulator [Kordiimonas sediminis]